MAKQTIIQEDTLGGAWGKQNANNTELYDRVDQDVSTDATPEFAGLTINGVDIDITSALTDHINDHPIPTIRDDRNQITKSTYEYYVNESEKTTIGQIAGTVITDTQLDELVSGENTTLHSHATTDNSIDVSLDSTAIDSGLSISDQVLSNRAATNAQTGYATAEHISAIEANTAKETDVNHNVSTNLSEGTTTETTVNIDSSDGVNATLQSASTIRAGLLAKTKFDEITANTVKETNVSTDISVLASPTTIEVQSSDGTNDIIASADATNAGVMTKVTFDEHTLNTTHIGLTNNPHNVNKTDVGLSNVPNVDCTNASNISSGMLSSSVIPSFTFSSTQVADSEVAMLALTTSEGSIVVRTDSSTTYIHNGGTAGTMVDFTELLTPVSAVSSVNNETGSVVLTTGDVNEDVDYNYVTDSAKAVVETLKLDYWYLKSVDYLPILISELWDTQINSYAPDLSSREFVGVASNLLSIHTADHPIPTIRDSRNEIVGVAAELLNSHTTNHPIPTIRDSRNQIAKDAADLYMTSAERSKLSTVEAGSTADQTNAEILAAVQTQSGRVLAIDGAKLDGIESGATADQTKSDIDSLGIAAATANKLSTARTISLTGDVSGSVSFNGSVNVSMNAVIADDSHNHTISNVDGLQTVLDAKATEVYVDNVVSGYIEKSTNAIEYDDFKAQTGGTGVFGYDSYGLPTKIDAGTSGQVLTSNGDYYPATFEDSTGTTTIADGSIALSKLEPTGTTGYVLTSNGVGSYPTYQSVSAASTTPMTDAEVLTAVESGMTAVSYNSNTKSDYTPATKKYVDDEISSVATTATIADDSITLAKLAPIGTTGYVLTSNGTSASPSYQAVSTGTSTGTGYINIVDDYGCIGDGLVNDYSAYLSAVTASQESKDVVGVPDREPSVLIIPAGSYYLNDGNGLDKKYVVTSTFEYINDGALTAVNIMDTAQQAMLLYSCNAYSEEPDNDNARTPIVVTNSMTGQVHGGCVIANAYDTSINSFGNTAFYGHAETGLNDTTMVTGDWPTWLAAVHGETRHGTSNGSTICFSAESASYTNTGIPYGAVLHNTNAGCTDTHGISGATQTVENSNSTALYLHGTRNYIHPTNGLEEDHSTWGCGIHVGYQATASYGSSMLVDSPASYGIRMRYDLDLASASQVLFNGNAAGCINSIADISLEGNSSNGILLQGTYSGDAIRIEEGNYIAFGGYQQHRVGYSWHTVGSQMMIIDSIGMYEESGTVKFVSSTNVIKTFVIDHPSDPDKLLVHGTLEGPEGAVYYRGESALVNGQITIDLPNYFEALTRLEDRTVLLTKINGFDNIAVKRIDGALVNDGQFTVYSDNLTSTQEFCWEVKAVRSDVNILEIEPLKADTVVKGDGPYTYI